VEKGDPGGTGGGAAHTKDPGIGIQNRPVQYEKRRGPPGGKTLSSVKHRVTPTGPLTNAIAYAAKKRCNGVDGGKKERTLT